MVVRRRVCRKVDTAKPSLEKMLFSLNEDYPLSYRDTCWGLRGLVPPYCALLKYIGFIDLEIGLIV